MAIGSGLAAQFGIAAESTYGTYVAPTRFYEFDSQELKKVKNTAQGAGLAAGRFMHLGSRRVVTSQAGGGSVQGIEVSTKSMGLLLNHLTGGTATVTQQGATAAYLQTHTFADNVGKYLTGQTGVPGTNGTVNPYTFLGGKVLSAEFSCGLDETVKSNWEFDFKRLVETETLASASYASGLIPFNFAEMNIKLGTYASEASVSGVRKATVKFERPQATDRFYAGATVAGTKAEPLMSDFLMVSGSFEVDLVTKADFADRYAADTSTACVVEWVGATAIAATHFPTFRIKIPQIFLDEGTPTVGGPGVVTTTFNFVGTYDGTNLPSIEYMSTDTAI